MTQFGSHIKERRKHKTALMQPWMRQSKALRLNDSVAVVQNVEIERPRAPPHLTLAMMRGLDRLQQIQQPNRRQRRRDLRGGVQIPVLPARPADGRGFIERRQRFDVDVGILRCSR